MDETTVGIEDFIINALVAPVNSLARAHMDSFEVHEKFKDVKFQGKSKLRSRLYPPAALSVLEVYYAFGPIIPVIQHQKSAEALDTRETLPFLCKVLSAKIPIYSQGDRIATNIPQAIAYILKLVEFEFLDFAISTHAVDKKWDAAKMRKENGEVSSVRWQAFKPAFTFNLEHPAWENEESASTDLKSLLSSKKTSGLEYNYFGLVEMISLLVFQEAEPFTTTFVEAKVPLKNGKSKNVPLNEGILEIVKKCEHKMIKKMQPNPLKGLLACFRVTEETPGIQSEFPEATYKTVHQMFSAKLPLTTSKLLRDAKKAGSKEEEKLRNQAAMLRTISRGLLEKAFMAEAHAHCAERSIENLHKPKVKEGETKKSARSWNWKDTMVPLDRLETKANKEKKNPFVLPFHQAAEKLYPDLQKLAKDQVNANLVMVGDEEEVIDMQQTVDKFSEGTESIFECSEDGKAIRSFLITPQDRSHEVESAGKRKAEESLEESGDGDRRKKKRKKKSEKN